jgi:hypothetical protein
MSSKLKRIAAAAVFSFMMIAGVVVATTTPAGATGDYCGPGVTQPCALIWTKKPPLFPQADCKVYMRFYNPGFTTIPRSIAVFHDGNEVFGDDDFIGHGFTPSLSQDPMTFGPLSDGEWRILVTSGSTVMGDKTFDFNCGL